MRTFCKAIALMAALTALWARPALAQGAKGQIDRALACQAADGDLSSLMAHLASEDSGMRTPVHALATPSGNLYRLTKPALAFGYASSDIYVAPGRIALAVSGQSFEAVTAKLKLTPDPYGPAERRLDPTHTLIAYQLHQPPLAGKVLIGCAYEDPAALGWLGQDAMGF